jgi:hypothetical protein
MIRNQSGRKSYPRPPFHAPRRTGTANCQNRSHRSIERLRPHAGLCTRCWRENFAANALPHCSVGGCNHAFVNRFILLPKFSLVPVEVDCHESYSASGSGSTRVRIPQPPSPPGLLGPDPGRAGPFPPPPSGGRGRGLVFMPCPSSRSWILARSPAEVMSLLSDITRNTSGHIGGSPVSVRK